MKIIILQHNRYAWKIIALPAPQGFIPTVPVLCPQENFVEQGLPSDVENVVWALFSRVFRLAFMTRASRTLPAKHTIPKTLRDDALWGHHNMGKNGMEKRVCRRRWSTKEGKSSWPLQEFRKDLERMWSTFFQHSAWKNALVCGDPAPYLTGVRWPCREMCSFVIF